MVSYLQLCIHNFSGHFPVLSFCFCSVNVIHLIWWACIWSLRLPFRKRATCNLLLVFVFTLSLSLFCLCVSFCICIFFFDFVSWRDGLHSKYLVAFLENCHLVTYFIAFVVVFVCVLIFVFELVFVLVFVFAFVVFVMEGVLALQSESLVTLLATWTPQW